MQHEIPGYPGYKVDTKAQAVYNKAGKQVTEKKGTGKYYLLNSQGVRKLIAFADIAASVATPAETAAVSTGFTKGDTVSFKKMKGGETLTGEFIKAHVSTRDNKTYCKVKVDGKYYFAQATKVTKC